ncbi:MAG TPA: zf-HC2 domain-containing protein, partial [Gemmatimonadaceae bacterium]|nr:zf-HC2 domain-containing protein [Gemmatimonadaceae bacterium]
MPTCASFQALLPDYLEANALSPPRRAAAEAHIAGCAECAALVADLRSIVRDARDLPPLTPSRELWDGIEARIEAPVVALPTKPADAVIQGTPAVLPSGAPAPAAATVPWKRFAIAASLLMAATAGVTYTLTSRSSLNIAVRDPAAVGSPAPSTMVQPVVHRSATETFDREIEALRKLVDSRRGDLDPVTVGIVDKNLKLIDKAIAESKAALAND